MNRLVRGRLLKLSATVVATAINPLAIAVTHASSTPTTIQAMTVRAPETFHSAATELEQALKNGAPDSYSGLWIDAGRVHVALTVADGSAVRILRTFRFPSQLTVTTGDRFTYAQLQKVLTRVTADRSDQERAAVHVSVVYVDVKANVVAVGVASDMRQAAGYLRQHYQGSPVRLEHRDAFRTTSCVTRTACTGSIQGGVVLTGGGFECTSGVVVGALTNSVKLLTAGHCFLDGTLVAQGGTPVGNVQVREFEGQLDDEIISINSLLWKPSNCEFTFSPCGNTADHGINVSVGDPDCKAGLTTGYHCGSIIQTGATINVTGGPQLTNQNLVNLCSLPGDSGGPNLDLGFDAIEGVTSTSNFMTNSNGQAVCNSTPFTTFASILNFFAFSGNYLPFK